MIRLMNLMMMMLILSAPVSAEEYNITDNEGNVVGSLSFSTTTTTTTTVAPPVTPVGDSDGDGVNDNIDQCPNTLAGVSVDSSGCETTVVSSEYCGNTVSGVTCSADNNMDSWWEYSGNSSQTIRGDIVALPFTARNSSVDGGSVSVVSKNGAFINGESFWMWISDSPGGPQLYGNECSNQMAQARGNIYWTQNPKYTNSDRICYLGNYEQTLYLNFTACETDGSRCTGPISPRYTFEVRRSYRAY